MSTIIFLFAKLYVLEICFSGPLSSLGLGVWLKFLIDLTFAEYTCIGSLTFCENFAYGFPGEKKKKTNKKQPELFANFLFWMWHVVINFPLEFILTLYSFLKQQQNCSAMYMCKYYDV